MDSIQQIFTQSVSFSADQDQSAVREGVRQVAVYNLSTDRARFQDYCSSFRGMNLNDARDGTPPLSDQSFSSNAASLLATPLIDFDEKIRDLEHFKSADLGPALIRKGSEVDDAEAQALLFSLTNAYARLAHEEPVPVTTFPTPPRDIELSAWLSVDDDDSVMDDAAALIVDIVNFDVVDDDQANVDDKTEFLVDFDTSRARIMQDTLPIDCGLAEHISFVPTAAHAELSALAAEFTMYSD